MVDGSSLSSGPITKESILIQMTIGVGHSEKIKFDVVDSPIFPIILGIPWLRLHDPAIQWSTGVVSLPSSYCQSNCNPSPTIGVMELDETTIPTTSLPEQYHDFLDVFDKKKAESLPPRRHYDCPIDLLPGAPIPYGRIFPLSEPELKVLKEYIQENLQKTFIQPSTSPAGAGIFFVDKKDGGLRPCVDYRELNRVTIKNRYPLPLIPELLERLQKACIYSKLDLRGAYNLVRVREGDEWKTAFRTRYGHFEYNVMPYGLCNAPATFQHFVNDIFRDLLDQFVVIYLDDILIFSSSLQEHRQHVTTVLQRLRENHLYAKLEKCTFETTKVEFLGFIISPGSIEMDPRKVEAITAWPVPSNPKEVQRFIGFANFYRRFIRDFSKITQPLTALTSPSVKFRWTEEAQRAFDKLRDLFISAPVLQLPNPQLPFTLEVDASEFAVGAVLSQRSPLGQLHPVAYYSKRLCPAERNYDIGDRELLAIKRAFEEWRHLLEGTSNPVTVYTDHKNLEYLKSAKRLKPRQARWALFFARFNFHVTYRPGSKNGKADALSRVQDLALLPPTPSPTVLPTQCFLGMTSCLHDKIKQLTASTSLPVSSEGFHIHNHCIYVPEEARKEVLHMCHDSLVAGHPGRRKTVDLLKRHFWWPSMFSDVNKYVAGCPTCLRSKHTTTKVAGLLHPLPIPTRPWSQISTDFIVDLPPSHKNTVIMVVVDRLTKMAHFIPYPKLPTAAETASLFLHNVFKIHGIPDSIVSDRGTQFTSRFWKAFCSLLRIQVSLSTAFHPQSNGQTERVNQTLNSICVVFPLIGKMTGSSCYPSL
uniref:Gypsy retrotransposon integrase-like protein 1 n=1 Tax=Leptobrachium leishanense TaxID=445787 RepID=A0A8C5R7U4_9ANUR